MAMTRYFAGLVLILLAASPAAAQHGAPDARMDATTLAVGAHVVPLATHVTPIRAGASKTEVYLTQPTLLGAVSALSGALRVNAAISLEGLTLDRGELGAGAYGEGYVDRRHPHTYLHELMIAARHDVRGAGVSLAAGRGFAPFGTDDPMMRPFVKFPVNHHLGQVLERLVAIAGVRAGPVTIEAALFNGSEPIDAQDMGSLDRFGDSWSGRVTVEAVPGLELQASRAWIVSPELPVGGGWDQRKWSASARYDRAHAFGDVYALGEWNRTTQVDRGADIFSFGSVLVEAGVSVGGWRPAVRIEHAERPEEERLSDPFRTPWPHGGGHILGITRWTSVAARIERSAGVGPFTAAPFIEASLASVAETADGVFDPREFYGSDRLWTVSIGARIRAGWHPQRMGRYGVAIATATTHEH
jgi:hypothetical protein